MTHPAALFVTFAVLLSGSFAGADEPASDRSGKPPAKARTDAASNLRRHGRKSHRRGLKQTVRHALTIGWQGQYIHGGIVAFGFPVPAGHVNSITWM